MRPGPGGQDRPERPFSLPVAANHVCLVHWRSKDQQLATANDYWLWRPATGRAAHRADDLLYRPLALSPGADNPV